MTDSEQKIINYLLGQLSEPERAELEQSYFADARVFDRLDQIETDLMDDYARGRLSEQMSKRFEQVYRSNPDRRARLKFSEALMAKLDVEQAASLRSGTVKPRADTSSSDQAIWSLLTNRHRTFALTLSLALLILLAGSTWLFVRTTRLQDQLNQTRDAQATGEQHERELRQQLIDEQARNLQLTTDLERAEAASKAGGATPGN